MEWNIRHGSARDKLTGMINSIKDHDPDIIGLLEFRQERIIEISLALASIGWPYLLCSQPPQNTNGILVASKKPLEIVPREHPDPELPHRWIEVVPTGSDLRVLMVHVPSVAEMDRRMKFWDDLISHARSMMEKHARAVIIGDLNTGLADDAEGAVFLGSDKLQALLDLGWRDVWREYRQKSKEFSWYGSKGQGYRNDHVLITPFIDRPVWAKYSHQERIDDISDHSPLILDILQRIGEGGMVQGPLR
jgi:exodeoxyribonuclease-3